MGAAIGEVLPLAVGVAISPVPVIAVILMLLSPRAGGTSTGFGLGWVAGIAAATAVVVLVADGADLDGGTSEPSTTSSWVKLVLGVLLLGLGVHQFAGRPKRGESAPLPKWMSAVDGMTPAKATALGFALAAVNPKNLLMCVAAGVAVGGAGLSTGSDIAVVAIFTLLAASTVLVPVAVYAAASARMQQPLDELKVWLQANNTVVMSVLLVVLAAVLIGKGISGLSA